mmetsp:Transcript_13251/g.24441  ORF Transcript_13251/g.24441 Transcript_13251/m.24441 type:complete len:116 (-) Transcript_13251:76-423(-)
MLRSATKLPWRRQVLTGRTVAGQSLSRYTLLRNRQFCSPALIEASTKKASEPVRSSFGGRVRAVTTGFFLATTASAGALVSQVIWSFDELFLAAHDMTRRLATVERRVKALEGKP